MELAGRHTFASSAAPEPRNPGGSTAGHTNPQAQEPGVCNCNLQDLKKDNEQQDLKIGYSLSPPSTTFISQAEGDL